MPSLQQILWAIIIGVAIGAVMTFYTKRVLGGFIKKLLERDAFDPESAVGFDELGIKKSGLLKYSLREGTSFSETVLNEGGKYYIPESSIDKAEKKIRRGNNVRIRGARHTRGAFRHRADLQLRLPRAAVDARHQYFLTERKEQHLCLNADAG